MMQAAIYGRLGGAPRDIVTKTGKTMAVASLAVDVVERGNDDPQPEWLGIVAFGANADRLLKHGKGDLISVSGRVQRSVWTKDGERHSQLQIVVDALVSARTARPSQTRKKPKDASADDLDDALAF
jgi:single-stranded DNA-binding protein